MVYTIDSMHLKYDPISPNKAFRFLAVFLELSFSVFCKQHNLRLIFDFSIVLRHTDSLYY